MPDTAEETYWAHFFAGHDEPPFPGAEFLPRTEQLAGADGDTAGGDSEIGGTGGQTLVGTENRWRGHRLSVFSQLFFRWGWTPTQKLYFIFAVAACLIAYRRVRRLTSARRERHAAAAQRAKQAAQLAKDAAATKESSGRRKKAGGGRPKVKGTGYTKGKFNKKKR